MNNYVIKNPVQSGFGTQLPRTGWMRSFFHSDYTAGRGIEPQSCSDIPELADSLAPLEVPSTFQLGRALPPIGTSLLR